VRVSVRFPLPVLVCFVVVLGSGGCKSREPERKVSDAAAVVDVAALYRAGKAALADKRLAEAIDDFSRASTLATDPELRANAWLALGAAYGERGDHARAVAAYEQVTVLRPDDADAWRVLAEGYAAGANRKKQAAALEHVIAIDGDDLSAYLDLAPLDVAIGKESEGKDVYLRYEARRRDAIVTLGKAKDTTARVHAAETLSGARDADTARALVLALTDREPEVRVACTSAIARIGVDVDPEIRPALNALLKHEKNERVRAAVADALGHP
jgi:tetratricopeptide (TPR) repeat protein